MPDRPWEVIRLNHTGTVTPIRRFRHEPAADLYAAIRDTLAVLRNRGAAADHHYDVRHHDHGRRQGTP